VGSKTFLQQNSPVHNWGCQLTWLVLYNGCKMVVVFRILCWMMLAVVKLRYKRSFSEEYTMSYGCI